MGVVEVGCDGELGLRVCGVSWVSGDVIVWRWLGEGEMETMAREPPAG